MKHEWKRPWASNLGVLSRRRVSSSLSQADRQALHEQHAQLMAEWERTHEVTVIPPEPVARFWNPAGIPQRSLITA